tara:strand:+ start:3005 stop:3199 length:195 start_codon:yes stop_codon:yes gene_type:complete
MVYRMTEKYFEAQETGPDSWDVVEFEKTTDGTFHVAVLDAGVHINSMTMTAEQFTAFKQWVMEN